MCKILGGLIDSSLDWSSHVQYIKSKLVRASYLFYKIRNVVSADIFKMLYFSLVHCHLKQGFSNFWCCGAHEEIDHNLRSPTINFINAVIASLDSCKSIQVSILISKRIDRGAPKFLSRSPGAPYGAL